MKFDEMGLDKALLRATADMGYTEPTKVQELSIPILRAGKDLIAQSETGSGKTAAFGLPILEKIQNNGRIQALIVAPTRELVDQIGKELHKYSKYRRTSIAVVYGGVSMSPQIEKLRRAEIVAATPGRLLDHMRQGNIDLSHVKFFVLDEADKMFDMGFIDDVRMIVSQIPKDRQTMLFSATIGTEIRSLSRDYMRSPESVTANILVDKSLLKQFFYNVDTRDKFSLLLHLLQKENSSLVMVFCSTRSNTDLIAGNLQKNGVKAMPIHGGHTQNKRLKILEDFHKGELHVLVATDVAARGLDIKNVTHVYNYDIPKTSQEYIHRIGRTARAGKSGKAISILAERDHDNFRSVCRDPTLNIEQLSMPQFNRVPFIRFRERDERGERRGYKSHDRGYGPNRGSGSGGRLPSGNRSYGDRRPSGGSSGYGGRPSGGNRGYGDRRPSGGGFSRSEGSGQEGRSERSEKIPSHWNVNK
jgi:ATP-dependent RNA helicase DeaD